MDPGTVGIGGAGLVGGGGIGVWAVPDEYRVLRDWNRATRGFDELPPVSPASLATGFCGRGFEMADSTTSSPLEPEEPLCDA